MPPTDAEVRREIVKANPRNDKTMFKIFQNVQYNVVQHRKYVKEMTKLYKKTEADDFKESFKNALFYLFTFGDTSTNVDRVIQFVATFCTLLDDEEEFLMFIFDIIFECQCVSGQSVRYRASQLLAAVLAALGDEASLDDDLCDKLLLHQMQRLQDTRGAVRCRAALALNRLQNPSDPDDEVTRGYRFHMSCDPSSSVRRAVVMSIAKCTRNVPFVLERLCDVDEAVRRAAFLYIAAMNVTQLRVRQRVLTLKVGLTERSPRVRRVVEEILIPSWLSTFQGNIIDFLKAIRLDNSHDAKDSQYVAEKLLESLFKRLPISELLEWLPTDKSLRVIPADKLNKETVWYWRHLAEHLQKNDDDETLETVLPDLVVLTGYIKAIVESPCPNEEADPVSYSTRQYVLHELARLLRTYDASDPAGRDALQTLITDTLTGDYGPMSGDVIRAFVSALQLVLPDVTSRVELVCNVLSTLREPPEMEEEVPPPTLDDTEAKLQRARLRVSLNVAMEAQEEAVRHENYTLAAQCKAKVADIQKKLEELTFQTKPEQPLTTIKEKQCDVTTLNKCLIILNTLLDTPQLNNVTPMLNLMFSELEVEIFSKPELLDNALETVALFGMLDKEFARDHKSFFFANLVDSTNEPTVCKVLKCIVDLLCVHGAKVFDDGTESIEASRNRSKHSINTTTMDFDESVLSSSQAHSNVIELLLKLMDNACPSYRLIIVEGLCRLMYLGHLESPYILSRLILLWFNPVSAEEDVLRQTIGIFFQTFPSTVDGAQDQIQKSMIPTLRALCCAPSSSPICEIDQEAVVKFFVSLTKVSSELTDSQGAMALTLCEYLVRKPTGPASALLCRALALLSPPKDVRTAANLATMIKDLCLKLPDKQSCRNLTRYLGALEALEKSNLNKMSNIGETIDSIQCEDTMNMMGRSATSLPQPLARSTHVVVNETVEEEPEIEETSSGESPTDPISRISEENKNQTEDMTAAEQTETEVPEKEDSGSDSSSVSPVKKAKISKDKKKNMTSKNEKDLRKQRQPRNKKDAKDKVRNEEDKEKGVKRSSRSTTAAIRAETDKKCQEHDLQESPPSDGSNTTVRRSSRGLQSGSSTESTGSKGKKKASQMASSERSSPSHSSNDSAQFDSDTTELHTIVYDAPLEQELLDDSIELMDSRRSSRNNVTIPETPEASEESDSELEVAIKGKRRCKGKKN
ncbi:condensin complex subunit 3 like protein [Danaus plexippus plexippus]|uniref:Condensin complex subunit 3 like protein n=1 Tax=Danaus plexippus plexippus TaxID=278856 RepID=A0A212FMN1_DANPL|nr:condensin complex subunit 3 like protein [Danaus plexippus plexippus]